MSDVNSITAAGGAATPATKAADKKTDSSKSFEATLKKVEGHRYARITEGSRKGQYVNQSGNERDGETFRIVKRDGAEYHVYGSGDDRMIVRLPVKTVKSESAPTTTSLANPG